MEGKESKSQGLKRRRNEIRKLLKACFRNSIFSLVPLEIWKDLVSQADLKAIVALSQSCYAFKELVEIIGENNFDLALMFRRICQIGLAKKYLELCAFNKNSSAMFHLGYSKLYGGWGLRIDFSAGVRWLKESAELGNSVAMFYIAYFLKVGLEVTKDENESEIWAKKALSSKNPLAIGFCYKLGLGVTQSFEKAYSHIEISANAGDEFAQSDLADYSSLSAFGAVYDKEKALSWYLKSAEQGNYDSQKKVSSFYHDGIGCFENKELAMIWSKKASAQEFL